MEKIGIDVHKVASQLGIRTDDGAFVEQRIPTTREAVAKHLGGRARARILLEASTESEWVARCLEALGHEVIVADPNRFSAPELSKICGRRALAACRRRRAGCAIAVAHCVRSDPSDAAKNFLDRRRQVGK